MFQSNGKWKHDHGVHGGYFAPSRMTETILHEEQGAHRVFAFLENSKLEGSKVEDVKSGNSKSNEVEHQAQQHTEPHRAVEKPSVSAGVVQGHHLRHHRLELFVCGANATLLPTIDTPCYLFRDFTIHSAYVAIDLMPLFPFFVTVVVCWLWIPKHKSFKACRRLGVYISLLAVRASLYEIKIALNINAFFDYSDHLMAVGVGLAIAFREVSWSAAETSNALAGCTAVAALVVLMCDSYVCYFTAAFFHSTAECIVGSVLGFILAFLFLWFTTKNKCCHVCFQDEHEEVAIGHIWQPLLNNTNIPDNNVQPRDE